MKPDVCLDLQKPPSPSLSPQIVAFKGQMAGSDGVGYKEVKVGGGGDSRIYLPKQDDHAGHF